MSSYQGISRIYRPQTFSLVLGQDPIITTLKNALRQKKVAQAYLFCGTRGTGKTSLARILAKALNCKQLSDHHDPCNACPSCIDIGQGTSLNVLEIDGASHRGIDDIRQLHESISYTPTEFGCKVFIIDEAHMLTKEAFNALLKTLEEPPPQVRFFLATTEPHKIPTTILSRCQRLDLRRIPPVTIAQKLIDIAKHHHRSYEEEAIHIITSLADGSMRVAESLLDQVFCFIEGTITVAAVSSCLGALSSNAFFDLDNAFAKGNISVAFTWTDQVFSAGKDFAYILESLLEHYRNVLSCKLSLTIDSIPCSLAERYHHSSTLYSEEQLLYIIDYLIKWNEVIYKAPHRRISLEMVLLHILRSKKRVCAADLVLQLQKISGQTEPAYAPPPPPPPPAVPQNIPEPAPSPHTQDSDNNTLIHHDTIARFAAVELEGTWKQE